MAGVDQVTGGVLEGWDHVQQSLGVIFSTRQGDRVMREWFGNPGLKLLGKPQNEPTVLMWFNIMWMLTELFEPRFKIIQFEVNDLSQLGFGNFTLNGEYRPYAHLDWVQARAFVSVNGTTVTLSGAD
jgi:phage baseplate assembly protein W